MNVSATAAIFLAASSCSAFVPVTFSTNSAIILSKEGHHSRLFMNVPFFAQEQDNQALKEDAGVSEEKFDSMTEEEEVEMLVQKAISKSKRLSKLGNDKGLEYAPWMGISAAEESNIRQLMRERTAARRARREQERDVSGSLFRDSQAQELSGTGLSYKIIDGEVELEWATRSEADTKGFIVKRRPARTNDYSVIASHKDWGPLASKGVEGGIYRYLDATVSPGGWVYRITEEDKFGNQADICQCLVEVQTEDEQKAALIAGVGFAVFALIALVAGITADPMNGF